VVTEPVPEALPGQLASFTFETSIAGCYAGKTHLVDALNYRYNFGILTSLISCSLTIPQPNTVFCVIFCRKKFTIQNQVLYYVSGTASMRTTTTTRSESTGALSGEVPDAVDGSFSSSTTISLCLEHSTTMGHHFWRHMRSEYL